jgi:hypothetical protein
MTDKNLKTTEYYTGWCPNEHAMKAQPHAKMPETPPGVTANPPAPGTGSRPGEDVRYRHTQTGTIQIWSTVAVALVIAGSIIVMGWSWISIVILAILVIALVLFGSLTVSVERDFIDVRFGIVGIIKKRIPLGMIVSVQEVKNPWIYGWGIRWTPEGPLYNVSGDAGVRLDLDTGKKIRIGTDEPQALIQAIRDATVITN